MFGYNVHIDPDKLNEAQRFLHDVGDDDAISTIEKLHNIKRTDHQVVKAKESEMLEILRSLYEKHDNKGRYCGLQRKNDSEGQPIWCTLESWEKRTLPAGK